MWSKIKLKEVSNIFGTITVKDFKATGYRTLTAEFETAVPEASRAGITVNRGNTVLSLTPEWKEEGKKVEFKNGSALPVGEYVLTVNNEEKQKYTVEAERVEDIVINGDKVLTGTSNASKEQGRSNDEAYIYYDVKNQYGESIRHRVTVNWNITSCDTNKEKSNRDLGLVVAQRKNDREIFTYGTKINVKGTCIKGDKNFSKDFDLEIGQQQAVQSVDFRGIVSNRSDEDKKIKVADVNDKAIDADFTKGTHAVLYQVRDQQGNLIESSRNNLGSATENAKLVLRSKTPKLVQDNFRDGGIFTIEDEKNVDIDQPKYSDYCSANIEPGRYVDQGGKVTFTYLATGANGTADKDYDIGEVPRLKSFNIEQPDKIIADGDEDVNIPFTAIDMNGNEVTDYKTIARSSNYLNFTASDGTLVLSEDNDGKAVLKWSDADRYTGKTRNKYGDVVPGGEFNPYNKWQNNGVVINDGIIRAVSLTATVEGDGVTDSRPTVLSVSDMRRPEWISDVRYGIGGDKDDTVIALNNDNDKVKIDIIDDIDYVDQYGEPFLRKSDFWKAALNDNLAGCQYALRLKNLSGSVIGNCVSNLEGSYDFGGNYSIDNSIGVDISDADGNTDRYLDTGIIDHYAHTYHAVNKSDNSGVYEAKVSYSVIRRDTVSSATTSGNYNQQQWYELGKTRNETYTIVPLNKVSDFSIDTVNKVANGIPRLGIETEFSENGFDGDVADLGNSVTDSAIDFRKEDLYGNRTISVKSRYKGLTLTVPSCYYASTKDGIWTVKANKESSRFDYKNIASGSSILLNTGADLSTGTITSIAGNRLKWGDLYKLNSGRYERQDAELELQLFISNNPDDYYRYNNGRDVFVTSNPYDFLDKDYDWEYLDGTLVTKKIKVSDAIEQPQEIIVADNQNKSPEYTEIRGANLVDAKVRNQYGCEYGSVPGHSFIYTIGNYKEHKNTATPDNDIRYNENYNIVDNKSNSSYITGVERKDTYEVTVELSNSGLTPKTVTVTADADKNAKIVSNIGILNSPEYELRYNYLGYNR